MFVVLVKNIYGVAVFKTWSSSLKIDDLVRSNKNEEKIY